MQNARNHLVWILGLALALGVSGVAQAASTQHIEASINKTKLPKKQRKGVALTVHTSTTGPSGQLPAPSLPAEAQTADIHFGKGFKFTTKGLAQCDQNAPAIQSGTTQQAIDACPDAVVGNGTAQAVCNPPLVAGPTVVTAFNGIPQGGDPTIILHARTDSLDNTTPLIGAIQGRDLHVAVPQLAAGICSLSDLTATIKKSYKAKGEKKNYVSARCKKKNKGLEVTSDWTYYNGPNATADNETPIPCKPKK